MKYQYTLAVDPGGTTGLAIRLPNGGLTTSVVQTQEELWTWFKPDMPTIEQVIVEEWTYRDGIVRPAGELTARLCSSLMGICYVLSIPISLRTPGSRVPKMPEAITWYTRNRTRKTFTKMESHEIDALAHLLAWEALHPELKRQMAWQTHQ